MKPVFIYSIFLWISFIFVAIANAALRENVFKLFVGELTAHQLSTVTFILATWVIFYIFFKKLNLQYTNNDLIAIGIGFFVATILFEFIAGHYVFGNSWAKLLADYNIFKGRVWSFVLLSLLSLPWLIGRK